MTSLIDVRPARGAAANFRPHRIRRLCQIMLATAGIAGVWVAQAAEQGASASTLSALLQPEADFTKICLPASASGGEDIHSWASWKGEPAEPVRMLDAAKKLITGAEDGQRDWKTARRLLEHLAAGRSAVSADAKLALGRLLLNPEAGSVDPPRAVSMLEAAARSGASSALLELARLREEGGIVAKSPEMAAALYRQAFLAGSPTAAFELARLYHRGDVAPPAANTVNRLIAAGYALFLDDLAQGDCLTFRRVSQILGNPASPVYDPGLSRRWLQAAVRTGDTDAALELAAIYVSGEASNADIAQALDILASIRGSIKASRVRAKLLLRRAGPNDHAAALDALRDQAERGDLQALALSAGILSGDYGGRPDLESKRRILEKAAAQPSPSADLIAELAEMLRLGAGGPGDADAADELVKRAAKLGHPASLQRLAARGEKTAAAELQRQADAQVAEAQRRLAELHLCGSGVALDRSRAHDLLSRAADRGDTESARRLAKEPRLALDPVERIRFLTKAAEGGNRLAMLDLASMYRSDRDHANPGLAEQWELRALRPGQGQSTAAAHLAVARFDRAETAAERTQRLEELLGIAAQGQAYAEGKAGALLLKAGDPKAALPLLTHAASSGNAEAMFALATADTAASGNWLERAAKAGHAGALLDLIANAPSRENAAHWLALFQAEAGCNAASLVSLARIFSTDTAAVHDADQAKEVLARAEAIGAGDPDAEFAIGLAYRDGVAAPADGSAARQHFERAYSAGHAAAALELGRILVRERNELLDSVSWFARAYEAGQAGAPVELIRALIAAEAVTSPAFNQAFRLLEQSASDGQPDALRQLAILYERGQGVATDTGRSRDLLRRSADAGSTAAMRDLANIYSAGLGVPMSLPESTKWIKRAAENGDVKAMRELASALRVGLGVEPDPAAADRWMATAEQTSSLGANLRSTRP